MLAFVLSSAELTISALSLLYTTYQDRRHKDTNINVTLPDKTNILVNSIEDFAAVLKKLKEIDPSREAEEQREVIEHFKKVYDEMFGNKK